MHPQLELIRQQYGQEIADRGNQGQAWLSLDPGGIFGSRQAAIEAAATNPYKQGTGFGLGINERMLGISDTDVAAFVMNNAQQQRLTTEAGQFATDFNLPLNQATSDSQLRNRVRSEQALQKGDAYLSTEGLSKTDLGLDPEKRYAIKDLSPHVARHRKKEEAARNKPAQDLAQGQLEVSRAGSARADRQLDAQILGQKADREYRNWKDAKDDEWRRWSYQQQLADKRESRADRKQALVMQMQQADLDRAYARERDQRADARSDNKARTAMLMQLVQGLGKLGYGMAI